MLIAEELAKGSEDYLSIRSVTRNGKKTVVEWNYSASSRKTVIIRGKTFTYDLVALKGIPLTGVSADTRKIEKE